MADKRGPVLYLNRVRRTFQPEFKWEAVRRYELNEMPLNKLAAELGIHPSLVCYWHKQKLVGKLCLPRCADSVTPQQLKEIRRLRRVLKRVTKERDILKKAISYFASPDR